MTAGTLLTDAPLACTLDWDIIDWKSVNKNVVRLQVRIAKAIREGKVRKARSLQWLLTHSLSAKLLAVKRVVSNKGKKTPGVDGVVWKTSRQKMKAVLSLNRKGYKPLPLRRIYIPKKNGKKRPLSIPTMKDRAMQALYALALKPVAETTADINSYGFREMRCCQDAIEQCFCSLAKSYAAQWILDADIKACFDGISHEWLLEHIPMDKKLLMMWLKAGFVENDCLFPTKEGTPQGGIISPILANMTLDGLEKAIKDAVPYGSKVNVMRYADDFVTTARAKQLLVDNVIPAIQAFLKPRNLELSLEKTKIVHINQGFDFLGQNIRKYKGKLLIKPTKQSVKSLLAKVTSIIKSMRGVSPVALIAKLNPVIRGWVNYHKHIVAKRTFGFIDFHIFKLLRKWVKRSNPTKRYGWIYRKYFENGTFVAKLKTKKGVKIYYIFRAVMVPIRRYIKVRQHANPYDPAYRKYFLKRRLSSNVLSLTTI
jgi:RNA-directed DNA polymerase